jgi:predicted Zn finger-like uncharacterized protein
VSAEKIQVPCPQCKASLAVPLSALGKSGRCPHCAHVFPLAMPARRSAPLHQPAAAATRAAVPRSQAASGLTPLASPGLTPLGDSGLTPLSADGGLTPLSAEGGLTPLPADAALMPVASNPGLTPMGASSPFSDRNLAGDYPLMPLAAPGASAPGGQSLPSQAYPYPPSAYGASSPGSSLASEYLAKANAEYDERKNQKPYYNNPTATGDAYGWGFNAGIAGGAFLMLASVVWFFGGLAFGIIFFYPPILFIIGLVAFIRGICTGKLTGD